MRGMAVVEILSSAVGKDLILLIHEVPGSGIVPVFTGAFKGYFIAV